MARRRKSTTSGDGSVIEDVLDSEIEETSESEGEVIEDPSEETQPEEVTPSIEITLEVEEDLLPNPEPEVEHPEEAPAAEVVVIDVEAGMKAKAPKGKPQVKVDGRPKSKTTPMPKRNVLKFVRK